MTRKISIKNLNNLFKWIVISVAILAIIYFIFLWTREDYIMQNYTEGIYSCYGGNESCYAIWHNYLESFRNAQILSGFFGFVMPIIFYVGKLLFSYIYPKVETQDVF